MTVEEKMNLLQELVSLCDGISLSCYDMEGNLLTTNSPDAAVLDTAFSAFGGRPHMLASAAASTAPVMLGTAVGLIWGAAFEQNSEGGLKRCWVLGPVFYSSMSVGKIELGYDVYQNLELSLAWKAKFIQAAARVPIVSNTLLGRYLMMLHFSLTGERISISDLNLPEGPDIQAGRPQQGHDRYQIYAAERALLGVVRNGDLDYKSVLNQSSMISSGVPVFGRDPQRQAKTSLVVFATLVSRAAIEGGLSPEIAYPLGDAYIQSGENTNDPDELRRLTHAMYDDFIQRVRRCRTNPRYSTLVQKCIDYIELHLEEKIQASDLAVQMSYAEYYLTRRFKQETGLSLTSYIKFAKIERAKLLLTATRKSVQEIADQLGFSNRSYFIQCFRSVTGRTPTEWRENAWKAR